MAGRPRSKNYEKNLLKRIPPELRNILQNGQGIKEASRDIASMDRPEFRDSPYYAVTKSFVNNIIRVNNERYEQYSMLKDQKKIMYTDEQLLLMNRGVIYRPPYRIPTDDLRWLSYQSSLIGAIHQIVCDDVSMYSKFNSEPGFGFEMKDHDDVPSDILKSHFKKMGTFLTLMGEKVEGWRDRDRLKEVLEMATRDVLTTDQVCYLKTFNRAGLLSDIRYIDPTTVFRVNPEKGYDGNKEIAYVQAFKGEVLEEFPINRIVYRNKSSLSDIKYRNFGYSPLESCIQEIIGMLHAIKSNTNRWNDTNPPKMIAYTTSNTTESQKQSMQMAWEDAFSGDKTTFKLPILFGMQDFNLQKLDYGSDMEFDKFIQFTASLIVSRHGVDPAVLGLRLNQSQALSESSTDKRQNFSRDRSHGAMMSFHEDCINEIIDPEYESPYRFYFKGVKADDKIKKADLQSKQFKTSYNLDEIRKENNLPTMKEVADEYLESGIITKEEAEKLAKTGLLYDNQYVSGAISTIIQGQDQGMGMGGEGNPMGGGGSEYDFSEDDLGEDDTQPEESGMNDIVNNLKNMRDQSNGEKEE